MPTQTTQFNNGQPLTPQQVQALRAGANIGSISKQSMTQAVNPRVTKNSGQTTPVAPNAVNRILSKTGQDYADALPSFLDEAGRQDRSTNNNPVVRTGENALAATASGLGTIFAPITNAIKELSDSFANSSAGQATTNIPFAGKLLDLFGGASNALNDWATAHPEAARNLGNALTVGLAALGEKPMTEMASDVGSGIKTGTQEFGSKISDTANTFSKKVSETASAVKEKVAPAESINTTAGKVLQGKAGDIAQGKAGLGLLDNPENIKTYKDLNTSATSKIKQLARSQDAILAQYPETTKLPKFTQAVENAGQTTKINYVKNAIDGLKELYAKTSDANGLSYIKSLESKAKDAGLTVKDVNQLARDYGSEFGSKAFGKTGEALTSVNATKFENIRTGLKDTARNLLPDEASRILDNQMTNLYKVRDLSGKMAEKVNTLTQRLKNVNVLQRIGGTVGKALRITGVGDLARKLLGIDKVPGAATLNPVELEAQLNKNLLRINTALTGDDATLISTIKDMLNHPK